jgi:hypothetical protein
MQATEHAIPVPAFLRLVNNCTRKPFWNWNAMHQIDQQHWT